MINSINRARKSFIALFVVVCLTLSSFANSDPMSSAAKSKIKITIKNVKTKSLSLTKGDSYALNVKTNVKKCKITYKSSKKKVVSVSKKGVLKAKKTGTAKITITAVKGKKKNKKTAKKVLKVKVTKKRKISPTNTPKATNDPNPSQTFTPEESDKTIEIVAPGTVLIEGLELQLGARMIKGEKTDENLPSSAVSFTSSDKKIISVTSDGKLKALKKGYANVTVTSSDNTSIHHTLAFSVLSQDDIKDSDGDGYTDNDEECMGTDPQVADNNVDFKKLPNKEVLADGVININLGSTDITYDEVQSIQPQNPENDNLKINILLPKGKEFTKGQILAINPCNAYPGGASIKVEKIEQYSDNRLLISGTQPAMGQVIKYYNLNYSSQDTSKNVQNKPPKKASTKLTQDSFFIDGLSYSYGDLKHNINFQEELDGYKSEHIKASASMFVNLGCELKQIKKRYITLTEAGLLRGLTEVFQPGSVGPSTSLLKPLKALNKAYHYDILLNVDAELATGFSGELEAKRTFISEPIAHLGVKDDIAGRNFGLFFELYGYFKLSGDVKVYKKLNVDIGIVNNEDGFSYNKKILSEEGGFEGSITATLGLNINANLQIFGFKIASLGFDPRLEASAESSSDYDFNCNTGFDHDYGEFSKFSIALKLRFFFNTGLHSDPDGVDYTLLGGEIEFEPIALDAYYDKKFPQIGINRFMGNEPGLYRGGRLVKSWQELKDEGLISTEYGVLKKAATKGLDGNLRLDTEITDISNSAFRCCDGLTGILIPGSVKTVGGNGFSGSRGVFCYCKNLKYIYIENGVTGLGNFTFYNCESLVHVELPDSLESLGSHCFWGCKSLSHLYLPESVVEFTGGDVEKSVFKDVNNVYYPGDRLTIIKKFKAYINLEEAVARAEALLQDAMGINETLIETRRKAVDQKKQKLEDYVTRVQDLGAFCFTDKYQNGRIAPWYCHTDPNDPNSLDPEYTSDSMETYKIGVNEFNQLAGTLKGTLKKHNENNKTYLVLVIDEGIKYQTDYAEPLDIVSIPLGCPKISDDMIYKHVSIYGIIEYSNSYYKNNLLYSIWSIEPLEVKIL